jgi:CDP-glucose 4,6-dehydratase
MALAEALSREEVRGQAFNFGNESPVTVMEMFEQIRGLMDLRQVDPVVLATAQGEIHSQYLSASKARKTLGWTPEYDRETGLRETIKWYRSFLG